jgi:hypothetical protein
LFGLGHYFCWFKSKIDMEQPKQDVRQRKPPLSREDTFRLMEEFEKRDKLSAKLFCKQHSMANNTFYYWLKRYRGRHSETAVSKGFIPLVVKTTSSYSTAGSSSLFAEVNGIRIYQAVPAEYLKALAS